MTLYACYNKRPRGPRICLGYETTVGHVACAVDLSGTPTHKKRCCDCNIRHDNDRRNRRRRRADEPAPTRVCLGHDSVDGVVPCRVVMYGGNRKRCKSCGVQQKRWWGNQHSTYVRKAKSAATVRKAGKLCGVCFGMPWVRDAQCEGCGAAYAPEPPIERCEVLRSNASGTFGRNYGR